MKHFFTPPLPPPPLPGAVPAPLAWPDSTPNTGSSALATPRQDACLPTPPFECFTQPCFSPYAAAALQHCSALPGPLSSQRPRVAALRPTAASQAPCALCSHQQPSACCLHARPMGLHACRAAHPISPFPTLSPLTPLPKLHCPAMAASRPSLVWPLVSQPSHLLEQPTPAATQQRAEAAPAICLRQLARLPWLAQLPSFVPISSVKPSYWRCMLHASHGRSLKVTAAVRCRHLNACY